MKLVVIKGSGIGNSYPVEEGVNVIGRYDPDKECFPQIDLDDHDPDARISREHALIVRSGGELTIEDLGSTNGTFLNHGEKIESGHKYKLSVGDQIMVGKIYLRVVNDSEGFAV